MKTRENKLGTWAGAVALFAMIMGGATQTQAATTDVTYNGKIGRLLQAKCMQCHHAGGIAPFSMETYADTFPYAEDMKIETGKRAMPPWNASEKQQFVKGGPPPIVTPTPDPTPTPIPDHFIEGTVPGGGFMHDRSLTDEQIALIAEWVDNGAPEGDPSDAGPNPEFNDEWTNGTPDAILEQPLPWTLNPGDDDIYRCFVLPTNFVNDQIMIGMEVKPSNNKIAHHAILFLDPFNNGPARDALEGGPNDGWTCFGGSDLDGTSVVGGWAPGGNLQPFDENLGVPIPAGSNIIIQMHYSSTYVQGDPETDQTQIGLKLSNDPTIQQLLQVPPTRLDFVIPADTLDHKIDMEFIMPFDVHLVGVFPHMHLAGTDMQVTAKKPGMNQPRFGLMNVDKWNFDWQNHYIYNDPISLPAGTLINIEGTYDNFNPSPIFGGERSEDEMLLFGLSFTTDAALPGLGQGGIPPSHDNDPPYIVDAWVEKGSTKLIFEFNEPIQPVHYPSDIDLLDPFDVRIPPDSVVVDGNLLIITWANLPTGDDYQFLINAFFGIQDLAGNYLDTNDNGIGGELADDIYGFFTNITPLEIVRQPSNQRVNQGENVYFGVELIGDDPIGTVWRKVDFTGTSVVANNTAGIQLNSVTFFNNAFYYMTGSNASGSVVSDYASLEVFSPPKPNSAAFVWHTVPGSMIPGQTVPVQVAMRNTSMLTWNQMQGYALAILSDPGGLFQGQNRIQFSSILDVVQNGSGQYAFTGNMKAPLVEGIYNVQFQMVEEGKEFFGPIVNAAVQVGSSFTVDFTSNAQGWTSKTILGDATASVGANGLCLAAPATGDNIAVWTSPNYYAPLVDGSVLKVEMTMSTSQVAPNQIPLWTVGYENSIANGKGGVYGGDLWFLDVAGGANGIGRPNGLTQYRAYVMPNAALTDQFRGVVDFANSAFSPAADAFNDMNFFFRVLDTGSAGFNANADQGTVCMKNLTITRINLASIRGGSTPVMSMPLNTASFQAQSTAQANEGLGTAFIDNGTARAHYALLSGRPNDNGGLGARKTLAAFNPVEPEIARLTPVVWEDGALYLGSVRLRSNVNGGALPEGTNPVKAIFVNFITSTFELGGTNYTIPGFNGNMKWAASPRLAQTTGGVTQEYAALFYGHNASDSVLAGAQRLGVLVDLMNVPSISPALTGADPITIESVTVERLATAP